MHRVLAAAATAALLSSFAFLPVTPAVAAPALPCASGTPIPGDYDGDGGADLLVNFLPASSPEGQPDITNLITPSDGGAAYRLDVPEGSNSSPVVNADLNGDLCSDVILFTLHKVLVVLGDHNGINMAAAKPLALPESASPGSLGLFYEAVGLRHDGISQIVVAGERDYNHSSIHVARQIVLATFTLDSMGNTGAPVLTDLDAYGVGWLVTSLSGSGATVAVGAPYAKVGKKYNAGAVVMLTASPAGALTYRAKITQNSPRVPGTAETNDLFGGSVSLRDGRLAIGVVGESIGKADAGMVQPILWHEDTGTYTAYRSIDQNTRGVPGSNADNDSFGYVVLVTRGLTATGSYDIAIATPNKKVGRASYAGAVTVANFTKAIYRTYTQNTKGVPGTAETGDHFGAALGVLHTSPAVETLLIGADSERSATAHTGYVIRSDGKKLTSSHWVSVVAPAADYRFWGNNFAR